MPLFLQSFIRTRNMNAFGFDDNKSIATKTREKLSALASQSALPKEWAAISKTLKSNTMTTNFFTSIQELNVDGDWKITITKDKENNWIVSVLFFNEKVDDDSRKLVPPMILKGTPQELDEGFFDSIIVPVEKAARLFANMEHYMKQVEEARLQSKMEKEKEDKEKKEKEERKKKYEAGIKKVNELEAEKKFGEAIGAMPEAEDFPEQAEEIKKKMSELREKHGQLSLL